MKILVFSDTHGSFGPMLRAVREIRPDAVVHLGDGEKDAAKVRAECPDVPFYQVSGNCDYASALPDETVVELGGVRVLLCHGHRYAVDWGRFDSMVYAAQEKGCRLVLFGHTHRAENTELGGVKLVNPGTAGRGSAKSCAMVEIFDNGGVAAEIRPLS
ncbi:MAG: metallophosphoesterase [Oscillospiraceae bacterium]|nr:metallophosphoesterase [Oscillospiraceae bacterium]